MDTTSESNMVSTSGESHEKNSPNLEECPINLLDLSSDLLEKIFSFLSYKQVAHLRPVCRQIDKVCQKILNSSIEKLNCQMKERLKTLKLKMPRRESARKNHPLEPEYSIISTLDYYLDYIFPTFEQPIKEGWCCFFPGQILDEMHLILRRMKVTPTSGLTGRLDELDELTKMAQEYFYDYIEPRFPKIKYFEGDGTESGGNYPIGLWNLNEGEATNNKEADRAAKRNENDYAPLFMLLMVMLLVLISLVLRNKLVDYDERIKAIEIELQLNDKIY